MAKQKAVVKVVKEAKKSTNAKKSRVVKALGKNVAKDIVAKLKTVYTNESGIISSDITVEVLESVLAMRKKKIGTHSEAKFACPTTDCASNIVRYRTLFEHFGTTCQPEGWERFRFWCDLCEIPRFWLKGTDIVRHKQDYHGLDISQPCYLGKLCPKVFKSRIY